MIRILAALVLTAFLLTGCAGPQSLLGSRPMRFFCPRLEQHVAPYDHRMFSELQEYAFPGDGGGLAPQRSSQQAPAAKARQSAERAVVEALARKSASGSNFLLLSGGGQWGAFGAGFLDGKSPEQNPDWAVVTGVSTGAIQTLFVGANRYKDLAEQYRITQGNPASSNGLFGLLTKGSEHDLSNLRRLLQQQIYLDAPNNLLKDIIANPKAPELFIAMVQGSSTDLVIVHLSGYIRANLKANVAQDDPTFKQVGECVTGLTLASSAIPLRLTPVQIDISATGQPTGKFSTFMDGGVRSSVIDQQAFDALETAKAVVLCDAAGLDGVSCQREKLAAMDDKSMLAGLNTPNLFAIRNGPTVVPEGWLDQEIDNDPDAYITALRGYSILVNQNELASLSEMRSRYPRAVLNFVSADGYDWMTSGSQKTRVVCGKRDEKIYFDRGFMQCLVEFGRWRRNNINAETDGWRIFGPQQKSQAAMNPAMVPAIQPVELPDDRAFERAQALRQPSTTR